MLSSLDQTVELCSCPVLPSTTQLAASLLMQLCCLIVVVVAQHHLPRPLLPSKLYQAGTDKLCCFIVAITMLLLWLAVVVVKEVRMVVVKVEVEMW